MYKENLALNNLQGLICNKTQPNCYIAGVRSFPIYDFIQKTYTWLAKGSIQPDVNLTAAAKTMNKMYFCARRSAQSFRVRMQEINSH